MDLPEFPALEPADLHRVLLRHGLAGRATSRLPNVGIFNAIFRLGDDLVLRVPRDHPAFTASTRKEAVAVPAAVAAGVRTARLLRFDDSLEALPVPFGIYEYVNGHPHAESPRPHADEAVLKDLGRDIARLHDGVDRSGPVADLELEGLGEPRDWLDPLVGRGFLTRMEEAWLAEWLDRLDRRAGPAEDPVLLHGDMQLSNVLVADDGAYLALLDWGGSGWGDRAFDFAGLPLSAVPHVLDGYSDVLPRAVTPHLRARIVRRHLHLALFLAGRPPQPGRSWAERPLSMILETVRFFAGRERREWEGLGPGSEPDRG